MIWALLIFPFCAFLAVGVSLPLLRKVAPKFGLVDVPGGRKDHVGKVPLIGGIVIFPIFIALSIIQGDSVAEMWPLYTAIVLLMVTGAVAQVSLTALDTHRVLAVLVGEDGQIENRIIALPAEALGTSLEQASNYLTARSAGRTLAEAASAVEEEIASGKSALDEASSDLVRRGLATWSEDAAKRPVMIVRGQANLLDEAALGDIERVRSLLDDLESKQSVASLLERARRAEAMRIFIGSENRLFSLSGSSVIASPYRDREGRVVGVLGVIGPTRLNYARVVPMVDFTARSLGKRIG